MNLRSSTLQSNISVIISRFLLSSSSTISDNWAWPSRWIETWNETSEFLFMFQWYFALNYCGFLQEPILHQKVSTTVPLFSATCCQEFHHNYLYPDHLLLSRKKKKSNNFNIWHKQINCSWRAQLKTIITGNLSLKFRLLQILKLMTFFVTSTELQLISLNQEKVVG